MLKSESDCSVALQSCRPQGPLFSEGATRPFVMLSFQNTALNSSFSSVTFQLRGNICKIIFFAAIQNAKSWFGKFPFHLMGLNKIKLELIFKIIFWNLWESLEIPRCEWFCLIEWNN